MAWWTALIGPLADIAEDIIDRLIPEKMDEKEKADFKLKFKALLMDEIKMKLSTQKEIIKEIEATIRSGWLSRLTRPLVTLTFHFSFWFTLWLDPSRFKMLAQTTLADVWGLKITMGFLYAMILSFWFYFRFKEIIAGRR